MRNLIFLLLIIPSMVFSFQVKGKIFRADSRERLSGATVLLKSETNVISVTQTEDDGSYSLDAGEGSYTLEASTGGFYNESKSLDLKSDRTLNLYLIPQSAESLNEVIVIGEKLKGTGSKNVISKGLREKATASITGDPMTSMTKMPGVSDLGFSGLQNNTKLSVRGGSGNENVAFLDEAVVQYPYHHFLSDSVFIDDIVDSIALYKGVIPARYGQAMSSLLEVNSIEGKPGFHGKFSAGLLNSYLTISGATEDQKWNYAGGIRRTYYDLVLPFFMQPSDDSSFHAPSYLDSHGRVRYKDGSDTVSFVWLLSTEPMSYSNLAPNGRTVTNSGAINYSDGMVNLDWKHGFNSEWFIEQSIGGMWNYNYMEMNDPDSKTLMWTEEESVRYKAFAGYAPTEDLSFKLGGEVLYYPNDFYTNYVAASVTNNAGIFTNITFANDYYKGQLGIYSAFFENEINLFDQHIYLLDGIRFNYVDYIKKTSWDPRVTLGYRFTPDNKIYASVGYLSEFPTDSWSIRVLDKNADNEIPAAWHYVLGTQLDFNKIYDVSLEGYFKNYEHYISQESNVQFLTHTSGMQNYVYGLDFLLSKKPDGFPLYGWISLGSYFVRGYKTEGTDPNTLYSLNPGSVMGTPSVTVAYQNPSPPVNEWFDNGSLFYKLDVTAIWDINKYFSLTSEFQWQSGSAYTPLKSVTTNANGTYAPVWDTYNSARLPDVHSLNLKLDYNGKLWDLPFGAYIQLNNVYNYRPVMYITYKDNFSTKKEVQSPIGIYPTLGVWLKW